MVFVAAGGSWKAAPSIDAFRDKIVATFETFWGGGVDPPVRGSVDGAEHTEGPTPCQGGLTPFLHFPHFSNNWHIPLPRCEPVFRPSLAVGFGARTACRSGGVLHPIPPCVIFTVLPLRKMQNASKSRTVESKSKARKIGDIVAARSESSPYHFRPSAAIPARVLAGVSAATLATTEGAGNRREGRRGGGCRARRPCEHVPGNRRARRAAA